MNYSESFSEPAEFEPPVNTRAAILDAGAQLAKNIDRRIRGLGVQSDIFPIDVPYEVIEQYGGVIISGGPSSVYAENAPKADPRVFESEQPILGICYGMQLLIHELGGEVINEGGSYGQSEIKVDPSSPIFSGLEEDQNVLLTHGDSVVKLPPGINEVARTNGIIAAVADDVRKRYGVQFHPEVDLTENGKDMLSNFLFKIAGLEKNYTVEDCFC
jgi:GMP synthase (glutamine-hydrolysing)